MDSRVKDVEGAPVRLSAERWRHIVDRHPELGGQLARIEKTVAAPDYVVEGDRGTLMAVKLYDRTPLTKKHCVVVYRPARHEDGLLITAYFATSGPRWRTVWPA